MNKIKSLLKRKPIKIILITLALLMVAYLALIIPDIYRSYKWQKSVERFQESIEKPYKEDIYGGKTPEETWQMFLDALEKNDLELASKYYDVEHQSEAKKWLEKLKEKGELEKRIEEMRTLKEGKNQPLSKNKKYYSYHFYSEDFKQIVTGRIIFYLNPYTKVWKILW